MNERIKALLNVCGMPNEQLMAIYSDPNQTFYMEQFAKLIVQECINRCEGNGEYKNNVDTEWGSGLASGIELCKTSISTHFGIKE